MVELYCLSQLLKKHPRYSIDFGRLLSLYRQLNSEGALHAEGLLRALQEYWPEMSSYLEKNHRLYLEQLAEAEKRADEGVNFVCFAQDHYPVDCYRMEDPPLTLSYIGHPAWKGESALSVVGSREPRTETLEWMEQELVLFSEGQRVVIVSGGARGVDQKAHAIALRKQVPTVVVLPSGLGPLYPESLKGWVSLIVDGGGALLSEYDFTQRMHKHLFYHRNRMIAALGRATLLVEARRRSGSLITAQQAAQLGRPVWVVPGHPRDPHFQGSLDLLSEGACLVRDAHEMNMLFHSELWADSTSAIQIGSMPEVQPYI